MSQLGGGGVTFTFVGPYGKGGIVSAVGANREFGIRNFRFETNTNWTASDIMSYKKLFLAEEAGVGGLGINRFMWAQIHEAGNSLGQIMGKRYYGSIPTGDSDTGWPFQICVLRNYQSLLAGRKLKLTY